ncbi:MAG: tripartite tricarboxylate transporter TctB family protein [SAR324 cluster bacterium]|nr:tripartite tricarboxylate transporter TctB family protein [SAR324 cluster bacterium]
MRSTRKGSRDILSGSVLLIASLSLYLLIPGQVETLEGETLTPASMPMAIAAFIAVLSAILIFLGIRQRRLDLQEKPLIPEGGGIYLGATIVVMLVYVALISWAGYIAATALVLLALALLFGNRNWKHILLMMLIAPPLIMLFFRYTMLVLLPQGIFFS